MVGMPILLLDSSKDSANSTEGATTGSKGKNVTDSIPPLQRAL